jgi:hypothetical protein
MDLAVEKVEHQMKITWRPMKDRETKSHRNCLQHVYSKILNDKRQTIIKQEGTEHKRKPMVRHPKDQAAANKILGRPATNYKKGKVMFYCTRDGNAPITIVLVKDTSWYPVLVRYTNWYRRVLFSRLRAVSQWGLQSVRFPRII